MDLIQLSDIVHGEPSSISRIYLRIGGTHVVPHLSCASFIDGREILGRYIAVGDLEDLAGDVNDKGGCTVN